LGEVAVEIFSDIVLRSSESYSTSDILALLEQDEKCLAEVASLISSGDLEDKNVMDTLKIGVLCLFLLSI